MSVLDKVGMKDYAGKMPHQISGGEQQRVAIASIA
jgi:cell division transport system ATP-binding protein